MYEDMIQIIIDEDEFDEEFLTQQISGVNFLTGSYGLLLCAEDMVEKGSKQDNLIQDAFEAINDLDESVDVVAEAMFNSYPPADLSLKGLLKLAADLVKLRDFIDKHPGTIVDVQDIDTYFEKSERIKELQKEIKELQGEDDD